MSGTWCMAVLRSSFRDTTVNPLFTVIFTLCRPHFGLMLERYTFAKACNHFDFGCAACGWCPRGTCDAIEPEHVTIRFAGCGYNTCELTSDLYIFHRVFSNVDTATERRSEAPRGSPYEGAHGLYEAKNARWRQLQRSTSQGAKAGGQVNRWSRKWTRQALSPFKRPRRQASSINARAGLCVVCQRGCLRPR